MRNRAPNEATITELKNLAKLVNIYHYAPTATGRKNALDWIEARYGPSVREDVTSHPEENLGDC